MEKKIEKVVLVLGYSLQLQYSFSDTHSMEREFEKHFCFLKLRAIIRSGMVAWEKETSLSEYYIHNQGLLLPDTLISSSSVSLLGHGILRCHKHACHGGSGLELGCGYVGPLWMVMHILTMRWQSSPSKWPLHSESLGVILSL